jgi:hypothetical protein
LPQIVENPRQHDMLVNVGEVAGVERVLIIHACSSYVRCERHASHLDRESGNRRQMLQIPADRGKA